MKRVLLSLAIAAIAFGANAQTGKNQISVGPELGLSTESGGGSFIGGTAKYMHGVGTAGQVTFTAGALFNSTTTGSVKTTITQIPFLAGYRHYFTGVFVEPQIGYIRTGVKLSYPGFSGSSSDGAFGYAIGGGYAMTNGLDLGVSFRNTAESGASGLIVFRVGYNFALGGK